MDIEETRGTVMKWMEGKITKRAIGLPNRWERPAKSSGETRRDFIKMPLALAAGSIAATSLFEGLAVDARADKGGDKVTIAPRYYPLNNFRPQINLAGKLAVITGASRGNGRAVGDVLADLGVEVIGTSRNPAAVPNPPAYPLLALDITDPASVFAFVGALQAHPLFQRRGRVDILVNNAGRVVVCELLPLPPTDFSFYLAQRDLAIRTVYSGHVMVTNAVLPLMQQQDYSRIVFTTRSHPMSRERPIPQRALWIPTTPARQPCAFTRTIWTRYWAQADQVFGSRR
jgi:hypothetical protein